LIFPTDLDRLIDQLSPEDWQTALDYWHAQGLTDAEAREGEAVAREVAARYPFTLDETRQQVFRAMTVARR
jgi:hypothetical protein